MLVGWQASEALTAVDHPFDFEEQALILNDGSECPSGSSPGGPCPLEVEPAEMPRDINDFSDEIESGHPAALHCFGGEFIGIHSASRHFGLLESFGSGGSQSPRMQLLLEVFQRNIRP